MKMARRPQCDTLHVNDVIDNMLISEIFQWFGLSLTLGKSWVRFLEIIIIIIIIILILIIKIPWNFASVSSRFFIVFTSFLEDWLVLNIDHTYGIVEGMKSYESHDLVECIYSVENFHPRFKQLNVV
jgi:hypothetical protein